MLRYTPNKFRVHSRYAVIIAKKVLKSSAKRNRVRRRVYEVIRLHEHEIPSGYDFSVTVFSPETLTMTYADLEHDVLELFRSVPPSPVSEDK